MTPILFKIQKWDDDALLMLNSLNRESILNRFFMLFSKSGNGLFYLTLTACVAILRWEIFPAFLAAAITAFAVGLTAHTQIKKMVKRLRPFELRPSLRLAFVPVERFSFPSGHTTHACLMATLLIGFFPSIAFLLVPWASMVGLSRVYFGVHYPSDIIAGMILGIACGCIGLAVGL